ncbi:MAG: COX15/CtaA family protein [bacterium]|nr:COX15/CtaA family protein [bacterium]
MRDQIPLWLHRFAVFTAAATLILIFVGALVTSTGSGLAVPDWPLSFGQVFPPMVGGVLFEHGHRIVASSVGMLMVTLMVLLFYWETRSWVRWLARAAVLTVVLQGLLGGLTVLLRLPTLVSVTHACVAQAFFCLTVILSVCTAPGWYVQRRQWVETLSPSLRLITTGMTVMIYVQLILGALMRHTGAGLAIADFPLAFGRLIPPFESPGVIIHFLHRLGAVAVTFGIGWTVIRVFSQYPAETYLRRPALVLTGLLFIQLTLGALTIWTQRSVLPMTAHVAVGAALLATSLLLTLRAYRLINAAVSVRRPGFFSEQVMT